MENVTLKLIGIKNNDMATLANPIKFTSEDASERERFTRLANALLKTKYRFEPQRRAIVAKMYTRWMERKWSNND